MVVKARVKHLSAPNLRLATPGPRALPRHDRGFDLFKLGQQAPTNDRHLVVALTL
jgi:hypothetical protein